MAQKPVQWKYVDLPNPGWVRKHHESPQGPGWVRKSLLWNSVDWYYTAWVAIPKAKFGPGPDEFWQVVTCMGPKIAKEYGVHPAPQGYLGMVGYKHPPFDIQRLGAGTPAFKTACAEFRAEQMGWARSLILQAFPEVKGGTAHPDGFVMARSGEVVEAIGTTLAPPEPKSAVSRGSQNDPVRDALTGLSMAELGVVAKNNGIPWEVNSNGGVMKMRLLNGLKGKVKRGEALSL